MCGVGGILTLERRILLRGIVERLRDASKRIATLGHTHACDDLHGGTGCIVLAMVFSASSNRKQSLGSRT